jgi:hypothetical protein
VISYLPRYLSLLSAFLLVTASGGISNGQDTKPQDTKQGLEFFEKRIRPILVQYCYECHSAKSEDVGGDLLLDTRGGTRKGGESGHAVVPKDLRNSLLMDAIQYQTLEMPPDERLPDIVIADFRRWIQMGAPDPREDSAAAEGEIAKDTAERLWSVAPLSVSAPPDVQPSDWQRTDIDRFVFAKLQESELTPVADAEPLILLRRVYFDLIGLPPKPDDVAALAKDSSPEAFASLVDRLLDSPQFGERWGRHWLDVVRYAESNGKDRDVLMPYAWRYRNYVIDAFNADVPFDRFITEQVAGDLLPTDDADERDRLNVATGLLAVGSKSLTGGDLQVDLIDDQIDVVTRAFLGLTASCARCHDHKFDPIPTRDYYALAGIFASTETRFGGGLRRPKGIVGLTDVLLVLGENPDEQVASLKENQKRVAAVTKAKKTATTKLASLAKRLPKDWKIRLEELKALAGAETGAGEEAEKPLSAEDKRIVQYTEVQEALRKLQEELDRLNERGSIELAVGVREAKKISDTKVHIRGDRARLGEVVPRGFLSCIELPTKINIAPNQSGRLELAQWLSDSSNPVTPRVSVNRIWLHLFGRGLVETVDNFGSTGQTPTHPELLDYLAHRFIQSGWSTKQLIRELVLSRTYQLASTSHETNYAVDPGNALYWRMSRRRLDAESIRDSLLASGGGLDLERPQASIVAKIGDGEVGRGIDTSHLNNPFPHRSVYLPIIRGIVPEVLSTFDFPEPSNVQGQRDVTNVPAQSLFLMNSPFVVEHSEQLAKRLLASSSEATERLELAYQVCFGRYPEEQEVSLAADFIATTNAQLLASVSDPSEREVACWTTLCHAFFASAEFRYVE